MSVLADELQDLVNELENIMDTLENYDDFEGAMDELQCQSGTIQTMLDKAGRGC